MSDTKASVPDDRGVHDQNYDDDDRSSFSSGDQVGLKNIEAISQTWTRWSLITAYFGIFLLAFFTSLEQLTTTNLTAYATSAFKTHSLIATVLVVQGVVNAVLKPPMAKIANAFGRLEAFSIGVFLYVIGYVQMAASNNVRTFASAQIFYSAGSTSLQILQQIFIADTSDFLNRALWSSLPDIPFLITVWAGPPMASNLLAHTTWRWGYGIWTIVLPVAFLPLALALGLNMRKAKKLGQLSPSPWKGQTFVGGCKSVCRTHVVQQDSVTAAGHITQTFSFTSTVSSIITGLLIKYTRHYKYFVTAGAAIYLMGIGLIMRYRVQSSSTAQIVGTQIAVGIGGGMVNVPAQLGVQASVSHGEVAAATAIFLTIVEIGGAVGSAISGAVWTKNIPKKLALYLPADAQANATDIFGDLILAKSYPSGSPEKIAIDRSYQETMKILLTISVCLAVPLLPLSLVLQNYKLDQMDQKVKGTVIGHSQGSGSRTSVDTTEENGQGLQNYEKGN
ncbi:hypothetical protein Q9189_000823 [Teloschistes chrysophthalmus]